MAKVSLVKLLSYECHWTDGKSTLVQKWQQQTITWANTDRDLCHQMVSLGRSELIAVKHSFKMTDELFYMGRMTYAVGGSKTT